MACTTKHCIALSQYDKRPEENLQICYSNNPGVLHFIFMHKRLHRAQVLNMLTFLVSSKESNGSKNHWTYHTNTPSQLSINFMHNRTKHCSNCVCIRSTWYYIGKQRWTTHFHFTEQENRTSVMLAGENKAATPWELSHFFWTENLTTNINIKGTLYE